MPEEKENQAADRGSDRRLSTDRRKLHTDPTDLPFPDRRQSDDRRQMDRRVYSDEERAEVLKKILVPNAPVESQPAAPRKPARKKV